MILVTGGSGFIGSYVTDLLQKRGYKVRSIDTKIPKREACEDFVKGSILDKKAISRAMKGCSAVLHLAAQVDVQASIKDPSYDFKTNALGTLLLLEEARKNHVEKFIYASSAAVYGMPSSLPISESHPASPISPYGVSKLTGEKYVGLYSSLYSMNTTALRLFNVYGKGQNPKSPYSGVITKFSSRIGNGLPPVIFGDGRQTRDFVHVSDVANAFLLALKSKGGNGGAINIGTGKETTLNKLAKVMVELSGKKLKPIYKEAREGDIKRSVADISKAGKLLGFKPKVSLREGLSSLMP
jgi:UDP-glucose 4-epimerase